jgi:hypothetical protein
MSETFKEGERSNTIKDYVIADILTVKDTRIAELETQLQEKNEKYERLSAEFYKLARLSTRRAFTSEFGRGVGTTDGDALMLTAIARVVPDSLPWNTNLSNVSTERLEELRQLGMITRPDTDEYYKECCEKLHWFGEAYKPTTFDRTSQAPAKVDNEEDQRMEEVD